MSIKKQIFRLLRIIKQLLIHKLFIHLDYLILIQQVLLILIGVKVKMISKKTLYFIIFSFIIRISNIVLFNTDYRVHVNLFFYINKSVLSQDKSDLKFLILIVNMSN